MFHCPEEDRNLNGPVTLLTLPQASEADEPFVRPSALLMRELADGTMLVAREAPAAPARSGLRDLKGTAALPVGGASLP